MRGSTMMSKIDTTAVVCENESMEQQNISLTPQLLSHAKSMVDSGKYASVSDYMRALIRRDQAEHNYNRQLDELLKQGIASGDPVVLTPEEAASYIRQGSERARAEADRRAG